MPFHPMPMTSFLKLFKKAGSSNKMCVRLHTTLHDNLLLDHFFGSIEKTLFRHFSMNYLTPQGLQKDKADLSCPFG